MVIGIENVKPVKAYRGDIDGLRAVAVISVMLYHFSVWPFTGGFVGVDVFFVISGYLITGGILKDDSHHHFSFSDFYTRRARRLFPALISTIAISYAIAFFAFSPIDFEKMSASTVFSLAGISNFYFWSNADYFDSASILKPLLHTWSLSVELQFYLVWPLFLIYLAKHGKAAVAVGAVLVTAAGFVLSVYAISHDSTGAYYLTQYRFWEFAAGGLVFLFRRSVFFNRIEAAHSLIFAVGIAFVIYPVFAYSVKTTFPGINALMPVIGSMLVILSGDKTISGHILSCKPMSFIGEISYSLYLIHWPVVVFAQYILVKDFSGGYGLMLVAVSFAIAIPMHRFIEKPLRNPKTFNIPSLTFCLSCALLALAIMAPAYVSWAQNGWVWRLPAEIRSINGVNVKEYNAYLWRQYSHLSKKKDFSNSGKEKIVIVGDSQSADILNMLIETGKLENYDYVLKLIYAQCRTPYVDKGSRMNYLKDENIGTIQRPDLIPGCNEQMDSFMDNELLKRADKIFIAMKWYQPSIPPLIKTIEKLKVITKSEIYVFGDKFLSKSSIELVNTFGRISGINKYASSYHDEEASKVNAELNSINGIHFVNMMKLTCPEENYCNVLTNDLKPIYFDPFHLTKEGAQLLGENLLNIINNS